MAQRSRKGGLSLVYSPAVSLQEMSTSFFSNASRIVVNEPETLVFCFDASFN